MIVVTQDSETNEARENRPPLSSQNQDWPEGEESTLRSLTRLLIGGALVGWDELNQHLKMWEATVEAKASSPAEAEQPTSASTDETTPRAIRTTLIGLLFETQDRYRQRSQQFLATIDRGSSALVMPLERRMSRNRRWRPVQERFERWVTRGESITARWLARGRREEQRSRRLAMAAGGEGFNTFMDRLGEAPALQELVRKQSAGLTQDAVDVVRARTVTGDLLAEGVARSLLRRRPRRELAPAPTAADQETS